MTRTRFLGLAIGLLAFTAFASWDSKFFWVGRVATVPGTNTSFTLPAQLKGQYVKANCHDDAGETLVLLADGGPQRLVDGGLTGAFTQTSNNNPVDTWLGVGRSDGGSGSSLGLAICQPGDGGGVTCDLVRFSLGEKFYQQMLSGDDTVWVAGTDAGVCDFFVAGN